MKRLPLLVNFLVLAALSASFAYWALQLFTRAPRQIVAAPMPMASEVRMDGAARLFGGQPAAAALGNYQLKGVLAASNERGSVAILAQEGKPARAYPVGFELAPGVTVKEVKPGYVLLSENGAIKRYELPLAPQKSIPDSGGVVGAVGIVPVAQTPNAVAPIPATAPNVLNSSNPANSSNSSNSPNSPNSPNGTYPNGPAPTGLPPAGMPAPAILR